MTDYLRYEARDYAAIDNLIKYEWREGDTLLLKCWNKEESINLSKYVASKYPRVKVWTSWLTFDQVDDDEYSGEGVA